jgi:hypothetical protein
MVYDRAETTPLSYIIMRTYKYPLFLVYKANSLWDVVELQQMYLL